MPDEEAKPRCFIAMPMTTPEDRVKDYGDQKDHFRQVMEALFVPAIEAAGYEAVRPEAKGSAMIQPAIIRNLLDAPLVLCDMSILNANVFFELGVRSALDKPVAMVRDHLTPRIPFDISTIGAHEYDGTLAGWMLDEERARLTEHLKETAANGEHNELWKYFGIRDVASEPPRGSEMERIEAMFTELLSERRTVPESMEQDAKVEVLLERLDGTTEVMRWDPRAARAPLVSPRAEPEVTFRRTSRIEDGRPVFVEE